MHVMPGGICLALGNRETVRSASEEMTGIQSIQKPAHVVLCCCCCCWLESILSLDWLGKPQRSTQIGQDTLRPHRTCWDCLSSGPFFPACSVPRAMLALGIEKMPINSSARLHSLPIIGYIAEMLPSLTLSHTHVYCPTSSLLLLLISLLGMCHRCCCWLTSFIF